MINLPILFSGDHSMGKLFDKVDKKYIIIALDSILVFLFMKYIFGLVFPFLLGTLFVIIFNPVLNLIRKTTHIGKGVSIGIILFFIGCIPAILFWFGITGFIKFSTCLPDIYCEIECNICEMIEKYSKLVAHSVGMNAGEIETFIYSKINIIVHKMEVEIIPNMFSQSIHYMKYLTIFVALWAITYIFAIMLAKDYELYKSKLKSKEKYHTFCHVVSKVFHIIKMYVKAQLTIMMIITSIVSCGLFFMGFHKFLILGIIIGILDILPFIGTGITLIPIAIWQLMSDNGYKAIGVLVLYVVCAFTREYLEPKLIGKKIGLHPLMMLVTVYLGVRLYGISGIITGPISVLIVMEIWREMKKET